MMLRASAENRDMARALGVDAKRVYLGVTAVGIACTVLAGVIAAPLIVGLSRHGRPGV